MGRISKEVVDEISSKEQNNCLCKKCHTNFVFKPDETWWDEKGYGYSTKLVKCKSCGCINVVKHVEDYGFSKLNIDKRYF